MGCLKLTYHQEKESLPFLGIWKNKGLENNATHKKDALEEKKWQPVFCISYTPFGLQFNSYQRTAIQPNRWKFNDYEVQDEIGTYMSDFRMYDPSLGRFWATDPIVKHDLSPYSFAANNPILYMDIMGLDTVRAGSGQPVTTDDVILLDDVTVTTERMTEEEEVEYDKQQAKTYSIYAYEIGDKVLGHRDGIPGLEDFFGQRTFGPFDVNAEGYITRYTLTTGIAPAPGVGAIKVGSAVKQSQSLLKIARKLGKSHQWRKEVNKLIREMSKGNFGSGRGSKNLFGKVHEMRGDGGARGYFINSDGGVKIVGYSDKATQPTVIKELQKFYGN
ncbi:MAG: RHS repeat-associated core domain-containing protein [Bacteroidota bacterium]